MNLSEMSDDELSKIDFDNYDFEAEFEEPIEDEQEDIETPTEESPQEKQEDVEETKDEVTEETETPEEEKSETKVYKPIQIDGMDIPIDDEDDLYELAKTGLQATEKLKEYRKHDDILATLKATELDENDLRLLADIKSGHKEALAELAKASNINLLDVEENEERYTPKKYGESREQRSLDERLDSLDNREEVVNIINNIVSFIEATYKDNIFIDIISQDIQSGIYKQTMALVTKRSARTLGSSNIVADYLEISQKIIDKQNNVVTNKKQTPKVEANKQSAAISNNKIKDTKSNMSFAEALERAYIANDEKAIEKLTSKLKLKLK